MSEPIIVALITSGVGQLGVLIGSFKEEIVGFFQVRKRNVSGHWSGEAADVEIPNIIEYKNINSYRVDVDIKQIGRPA